MGAFLLFKESISINLSSAKNCFIAKGFNQPFEFKLGIYKLLLYQKTLIKSPNFLLKGESAIFTVGSFVYKNYGYQESLENLLYDFVNNRRFDYNDLIGHYTILLFHQNKLFILRDKLSSYQLFGNQKYNYITTSYLAAIFAYPKNVTLNKPACYENFFTGYISGNETHFNEIVQADINFLEEFKELELLFKPEYKIPSRTIISRKKALESNAQILCDYYCRSMNLIDEFKMQIGLSSGYDSRLLLAAMKSVSPSHIRAYTHQTLGVPRHVLEADIVTKICNDNSIPLKKVPTKRLNLYDETVIDEILLDGFYFFDGRSSDWMGAFSETYTRKYRNDIWDGSGILYNGLGGEIYRNHYKILLPYLSFKKWMITRIYPRNINKIFKTNKEFDTFHRYLIRKLEHILNEDYSGLVSKDKITMYYDFFKLKYCDSLVCNANNQHSFFFTPFIEFSIIERAFKSRKHFGVFSSFQISLIKFLHPSLVHYFTNYGYKMSKIPIFETLKNLLRGVMSPSVLLTLNSIMKDTGEKDFFESVINKSSFFQSANVFQSTLFEELDLAKLRESSGLTSNMAYTAIFFYMVKNKITHDVE